MIGLIYLGLLVLFITSFWKTLVWCLLCTLVCQIWEYRKTGAPRDGLNKRIVWEQLLLHYVMMFITWPLYVVEKLEDDNIIK